MTRERGEGGLYLCSASAVSCLSTSLFCMTLKSQPMASLQNMRENQYPQQSTVHNIPFDSCGFALIRLTTSRWRSDTPLFALPTSTPFTKTPFELMSSNITSCDLQTILRCFFASCLYSLCCLGKLFRPTITTECCNLTSGYLSDGERIERARWFHGSVK